MLAAQQGHEKVVDRLLQHKKVGVNLRNYAGDTALMLAAYNGHERVVERLLQHEDITCSRLCKPM